MRDLITLTNRFELVVGKGFFNEKYAERDGSYEFLGNDFTEDFLKERRIRYGELATPVRELITGVFVLGNFPRIHPDELINPRFKLLTQGEFVPDAFADEIMVVADTPRGLVALLGCSHPGMRNMLDAAKNRFSKPIFAVLGGTHLVEASRDCLRTSIGYLRSGDIGMIGVSHCTGKDAINVLADSESRYFHNRTGSSLIIL